MKQLQFYLFIRTAMNNVLNSSTSPGPVPAWWRGIVRGVTRTTSARVLSPTYRIPGANDFSQSVVLLSGMDVVSDFLVRAGPVERGVVRAADELMTLTTRKILQCVFHPRPVLIGPARQAGGSRFVNSNDLVLVVP